VPHYQTSFEYQMCDDAGIVEALRQNERDGFPAMFVIASHPKDSVQQAPYYISVGRSKRLARKESEGRWRFLGEDHNPDGAGSHQVCNGTSVEEAAAAIALLAGRYLGRLDAEATMPPHVFRQYSRKGG